MKSTIEKINELQSLGKTIVLTNGCFDVLHVGHVTYLAEAKELGDVLVVGLNTDASITKLKGPTRPIHDLNFRTTMLEHLRSVDFVVPFNEDTGVELVRKIKPDVYVKGGDYVFEQVPEAKIVTEQGGEVKFLSLVPIHSSTNIIKKIKER